MNADSLRPPRWLRWTGVALVAGVILYSSLIEPPAGGIPPVGPLGIFGLDKWLHAVAYAGLAGSLAVALAAPPGRERAAVALLAVLLASGYGVGIEFAQATVPERYFSVADMAANGVGAILGAVCWRAGLEVFGRFDAVSPTET